MNSKTKQIHRKTSSFKSQHVFYSSNMTLKCDAIA